LQIKYGLNSDKLADLKTKLDTILLKSVITVNRDKHPESRQVMMNTYNAAFKNWPTPDTSFFVNGRFGKTYVIQWGNPENDTLVLLHGLAGNVTLWGKEIIEQLSKQFFIIAIETMGDNVGRSIPTQWPMERNTLRVWLDELLDTLKLSSVNLVGHSSGGWLAMDYAIHYQQHVKSLSAIGAAGLCKPKIGFMLKMMYLTLRNTKKVCKRHIRFSILPVLILNRLISNISFNLYQHCKQSTLYPRRFTSEELGRIKVPVLIVIGIDEHFFDVKKAEYRGNKHILLSQVHMVENAGHLAHIDRPEAVSSLVIGFH